MRCDGYNVWGKVSRESLFFYSSFHTLADGIWCTRVREDVVLHLPYGGAGVFASSI